MPPVVENSSKPSRLLSERASDFSEQATCGCNTQTEYHGILCDCYRFEWLAYKIAELERKLSETPADNPQEIVKRQTTEDKASVR
jgi:hypothetical protein